MGLFYYSTPAQKPAQCERASHAQCERASHRTQIFEQAFEQPFEQPFEHVFEQVFEHIPLKMDSS